MIVQIEEKINKKKTFGPGGMTAFYNNMLDQKIDTDQVDGEDIREKAKQKVVTQTNIDDILDNNEVKRQADRMNNKALIDNKPQPKSIRKEMTEILKSKLHLEKTENKREKKNQAKIEETSKKDIEAQKLAENDKKQEKIRLAKERMLARKNKLKN